MRLMIVSGTRIRARPWISYSSPGARWSGRRHSQNAASGPKAVIVHSQTKNSRALQPDTAWAMPAALKLTAKIVITIRWPVRTCLPRRWARA
jgi:hypothetical protein